MGAAAAVRELRGAGYIIVDHALSPALRTVLNRGRVRSAVASTLWVVPIGLLRNRPQCDRSRMDAADVGDPKFLERTIFIVAAFAITGPVTGSRGRRGAAAYGGGGARSPASSGLC
jgi:hypothetical protein